MKKVLISIILSFICLIPGFSDEFIIDEPGYHKNSSSTPPSAGPGESMPYIGSVPTPDNFKQGTLYSEFMMYDGGGVGLRLNVGIFNILSIGVSENFDHVVGSDPVHLNIPSAYLKFSLFESRNRFNYAFGFDSFAYGSNGSYVAPDGTSSTMYGFYFTTGKSYRIFGARNMFTLGLRVPLLPSSFRNITNSTLFMAATLGSPVFKAGFLLENVYLNFTRASSILPSVLFRFSPVSGFELGLTLQYQIYNDLVNRIFNLSYTTRL